MTDLRDSVLNAYTDAIGARRMRSTMPSAEVSLR